MSECISMARVRECERLLYSRFSLSFLIFLYSCFPGACFTSLLILMHDLRELHGTLPWSSLVFPCEVKCSSSLGL